MHIGDALARPRLSGAARPLLGLAVGAGLAVALSLGVPGHANATTRGAAAPPPLPALRSAGCSSSASTVTPGQQTVSYTAAGQDGSYVINVPHRYRATRPMPVVMDLHGYSDPASFQATITGLGAFGDAHGFITLTPQINYAVPHWDTRLNSPDLAFLGDLLTTIEHTACVNQRRVYVTGYSDGAFMTSAMACQYASRVAAVSPVAGIEDTPGCKPTRPVPVVAFHGTADPFVPYNGGVSAKGLALPAPDGSGTIGQEAKTDPQALAQLGLSATFGSIPREAAGWAKRNGCRPGAITHRVARDVTRITYHCPVTASVVLYRVRGGGHTWPGSKVSASLAAVTGRTTFSISANQVMWRFFQAHPLTR